MILKYKAWHLTKKIMVDVVRIDLENAKIDYTHKDFINTESTHQENLIVLPYTNVIDSKGTQIFLGDLINITSCKNKDVAVKGVNFCEGVFGIKTFTKFISLHELVNDKNYNIRVIGNIYE